MLIFPPQRPSTYLPLRLAAFWLELALGNFAMLLVFQKTEHKEVSMILVLGC